ncbi:MAG: sulfur carrier protein ThiS [Bacilli bacterium]
MIVNGEKIKLNNICTLKEFILMQGYNINIIALELNSTFIKSSEYEKITLCDDDRLEIVCLMGGG